MPLSNKKIQREMEDEKNVKELGSRIRNVRLHNNLTRAEFASALRVRIKTLSEIENGERKPSDRFLFALEGYFGIDGDWLMTDKGEAVRNNGYGRMEDIMRFLGMFNRLSESSRSKVVNITKILMQTEYVDRRKSGHMNEGNAQTMEEK